MVSGVISFRRANQFAGTTFSIGAISVVGAIFLSLRQVSLVSMKSNA